MPGRQEGSSSPQSRLASAAAMHRNRNQPSSDALPLTPIPSLRSAHAALTPPRSTPGALGLSRAAWPAANASSASAGAVAAPLPSTAAPAVSREPPARGSGGSSRPIGSPPGASKPPIKDEETRLRKFCSAPPRDFKAIWDRAHSQRFYVLKRTRSASPYCLEEVVEMAGSTGNLYSVRISRIPKCDCSHAEKGDQCKHIVYVLSKVLHAPYHLIYQLALLSSELSEIFANAPPIEAPKEEEADKDRKKVEGECPICFGELDPKSPENLVWCRAACGQNIHQDCFTKWTEAKQGAATCPLCRSAWLETDDKLGQLIRNGKVNDEGYVNVGEALGYGENRDTSTYPGWSTWNDFYDDDDDDDGAWHDDDQYDFNYYRPSRRRRL